MKLVRLAVLIATVAYSAAFLPNPGSHLVLRARGLDAVSCQKGRMDSNEIVMSASRREFGKLSLLGATALGSLLLHPMEGWCKQRGGDGGKWARHYGEFTEEELGGFSSNPSGLKYKDIAVGEGGMPSAGNSVQTHYSGYLLESGNMFDSSYERGRPLSFKVGVGQVIKGWDEALLGMKVGGKRQLIIPAELGYGARSVGPIPPNSPLFFYVELLAIGAA